MPDPDVQAWLPAAVRGEGDALERIVAAYRPRVYRYCRSRLWDHETAEDVTQEVVLAMVTALPTHRADDHALGAFVFGIASNQVAMAHRRRARRPEALAPDVPDLPDEARGPEDLALARDGLDRLVQLVDELPEAQREIVMLRIAAGLSAAETGVVVGMSAGAVRVAQHRALATLRELTAVEDAR